MSEDDEVIPNLSNEFYTARFMDDMTLDEQLLFAAQRGQGLLVKSLLKQGTQVVIDQVRAVCRPTVYSIFFYHNIPGLCFSWCCSQCFLVYHYHGPSY